MELFIAGTLLRIVFYTSQCIVLMRIHGTRFSEVLEMGIDFPNFVLTLGTLGTVNHVAEDLSPLTVIARSSEQICGPVLTSM